MYSCTHNTCITITDTHYVTYVYTVYHESFEAEKFRGFLVLRETFFHESISVAIEKRALIAITMGIRKRIFVKICVMH